MLTYAQQVRGAEHLACGRDAEAGGPSNLVVLLEYKCHISGTKVLETSGCLACGVRLERSLHCRTARQASGYSLYLLYWYKSANTDAEGAASVSPESLCAVQLVHARLCAGSLKCGSRVSSGRTSAATGVAQFTCFTSTIVQILTQKAVQPVQVPISPQLLRTARTLRAGKQVLLY